MKWLGHLPCALGPAHRPNMSSYSNRKMRENGTRTRVHLRCGTHCTSPIRAPNATQTQGVIVNVTLGVSFAWLALESMPTSMAVKIT